MNLVGIALAWCILQITLMASATCLLYILVRWFRPAEGSSILFAGMGIAVIISLLAFSPWPQWHSIEQTADRISNVTSSSSGFIKAPDLADPPIAKLPATAVNEAKELLELLWERVGRIFILLPATTKEGWHWAGTITAFMITALIFGLGRLIWGMTAVNRQRLQSQAVADREVMELVDVLRAELGCRTAVEIRQSNEVVTAATMGWRRPVILLAADWKQWTSVQVRAVLAHEVVHVRNHDFLFLLGGHLGLVLHFYHPLLHWLVGRLRLERELLADAAAARISGGQRQYLAAIAELALRQQDRPLVWPARAFLPTRKAFLTRIATLRDSKPGLDRPSLIARVAAVGAVLACGVLAAGLRGEFGPSPAIARDVLVSTAVSFSDSALVEKPKVELYSGRGDVLESPSVSAPPAKPKTESYAQRWDVIVEGIGWGDVRVGMEKEDLLKILGPPDSDSSSNWLKWRRQYYLDCFFRPGSTKITEIRFNQGFEGILASGLRIGSAANQLFERYGKPDVIVNRNNDAVKYEYSQRGVLFWTYQGEIIQIVVFNPYTSNFRNR
jgi:beta-lactamase regulating signal transducer with metallopeptidase domain